MNDEIYRVFSRVALDVGNRTFSPEELEQPLSELNIDSVELMEMFGMMEEELGLLLSESEIAEIQTLEQLLAVMSEKTT
jgi:acyl carrier protein